ncbi:MAG: hypothetical protein FGM40_06865 [Rhodocyclaceae bacterium]|nr:hypothetical protein [Rhodocyclaceae bacterium]
MRHPLICLAALFATNAPADWTPLGVEGPLAMVHYMDAERVRQTGPMAIYRQVHVLSQRQATAARDSGSTVSVHEYDCMNRKFRTVQATVFSQPWAAGEIVAEQQPPAPVAWQDLPAGLLGEALFDTLCPGGGS